MTHLRVDPATLISAAGTYSSSATEITAAATSVDAVAGALSVTFGVLGGDFVTSVVACTDRHRENLAGIAREAQGIADGLISASSGFAATDHDAREAIARVGLDGQDVV